MSSNRQSKQQRKGMPDSGLRYVFERLPLPASLATLLVPTDLNDNRLLSRNAWNGSRASPTFSPGMNSGRLPNGPPPSQQQPKETSPFPPLNQQNGPRPQEFDRVLQPLTGLIVRTCILLL